MKDLNIGMSATYINDYGFNHITDIPSDVAIQWAKDCVPYASAGLGLTFDVITRPNDWLNKLFVVVAYEHSKWIALYNHDGKFSVRSLAQSEV